MCGPSAPGWRLCSGGALRLLGIGYCPVSFCFKFDIGVYFVGVVALSLSSVTFDVRPSGMASFGGFDLF